MNYATEIVLGRQLSAKVVCRVDARNASPNTGPRDCAFFGLVSVEKWEGLVECPNAARLFQPEGNAAHLEAWWGFSSCSHLMLRLLCV